MEALKKCHYFWSWYELISSVHIDNKNKDILTFGERPAQRLDNATLTAEAVYPINLTQPNKRFVLNLHCNGRNSFLFVDAAKIYQFKAKNSEIKDSTPCLGNFSKVFTINIMKKTGLKEIVKFFNLNFFSFNPIVTNDILDIH